MVVEVLKIDSSRPAVNFKLAAAPNDWSRSARRGTSSVRGEVSERGARYQAFFQGLLDELREEHKFTNAKAAQPQNWYSFASGCTGVSYGFSFARGGRLRAEVYLDTGDGDENERLFDLFEAERSAIEAAFGEDLAWERLDGKRASRIARYDEGSISDAEDVPERHRAWAVEKLIKLKRVMQPRLVEATGG